MEKNKLGVFILTHGRPNNVKTYKLLRARGYTGKVYFILDNEDKTIDEYKKNFGDENIIVFDKKYYADLIDEGNNFDNRKVIIHARNSCFDIAEQLGYKYFIQLDDDYYSLGFRYDEGERKINNLDKVFEIVLNYYINTPQILSIAFSQGGDHIGGFCGIKLKRKCMNSFICSTDRKFQFVGSINEDVNTYTTLGSRGKLFFTFTNINLSQGDTQKSSGGMTDTYNISGTYIKSFHTVMMHPSGAKISMMNSKFPRIHHSINWNATTPMIINQKFKKYDN
jgi:hypothetical protein